jgi:hypothetical protein
MVNKRPQKSEKIVNIYLPLRQIQEIAAGREAAVVLPEKSVGRKIHGAEKIHGGERIDSLMSAKARQCHRTASTTRRESTARRIARTLGDLSRNHLPPPLNRALSQFRQQLSRATKPRDPHSGEMSVRIGPLSPSGFALPLQEPAAVDATPLPQAR